LDQQRSFDPRGGPADKYPLNQNNALFINVVAWPICLLPTFFSNCFVARAGHGPVWGGQFIVHGVIINWKFKSLYNPGVATVLLGFLPLGIWYLVEIYSKGGVTLWDWTLGVVYIGCFIAVVMLGIGLGILADKNSRYPFAPEEMERFRRHRLR